MIARLVPQRHPVNRQKWRSRIHPSSPGAADLAAVLRDAVALWSLVSAVLRGSIEPDGRRALRTRDVRPTGAHCRSRFYRAPFPGGPIARPQALRHPRAIDEPRRDEPRQIRRDNTSFIRLLAMKARPAKGRSKPDTTRIRRRRPAIPLRTRTAERPVPAGSGRPRYGGASTAWPRPSRKPRTGRRAPSIRRTPPRPRRPTSAPSTPPAGRPDIAGSWSALWRGWSASALCAAPISTAPGPATAAGRRNGFVAGSRTGMPSCRHAVRSTRLPGGIGACAVWSVADALAWASCI